MVFFELSGTIEGDSPCFACTHCVFENLVKGSLDRSFVPEKFFCIIIRKVFVLHSGTVVAEPSNSLESLQSIGRIRERTQNEQGDTFWVLRCSEVEASTSELLADKEDRIP